MSRRARSVPVLVTGLLAAAALLPASASAATGPAPLPGVHALQLHQDMSRSGPVASPLHDEVGGGQHDGAGNTLEIAHQAEQFAAERSAPADSVPAAALLAARQQATALPQAAARTTEVTDQPMNAEPAGYTDPYWSNAGAGFRNVSGRVTALATDGSTWYVGTADGGVWKTTDGGARWASIWDDQGTMSIGALLVSSDHALWVGTGEANTSSDSYEGTGVYRSTNRGRTFARVGGNQLNDHLTFRLRDDGYGHVYAATSKGLYRHRSTGDGGAWTLVLKPDPNPTGSPYLTSFISDVVVRPGTHGQSVLAVLGWRNGSSYNGFYLSSTGGGAGSFRAIRPGGAIDDSDIGRTTLAYAADGSRLYAIIESPRLLLAGAATNLQGVFLSRSGNPAGPYQKIAGSTKLGDSGSAIADYPGYHVGIQSWYNQALAVDPKNANHVYVSLEEVFQTTNGGRTFTTASPYWNYGLKCGASPCPPATHPDQHALALSSSGRVLIGNDGGVYSRGASITGYGHWNDLNATLHTLQYYDAAAATQRAGQVYWGGLQDNGTTALFPWRSTQNIEPAGGDGGAVLVDPSNGNRAVGEYVGLVMYSTQDGGHTFRTISPECGYYTNTKRCDPSARFIAPFQADIHDTNHWVAAGNKVWDSRQGFATQCSKTCDWKPVHSFGTDAVGGYNVGTALAASGVTTYAAWVDSSGNPSPSFASGIDTNYGGSWHRIASPVLPNRYVAGLTVDPKNPAHVYAVYNGYSRRWIPGGGLGTVFESTDGGSSWHNISGNLPDAPGDALAVVNGTLVLGTDIGLFSASADHQTRWSRLGTVPNASVNNVRRIPGANAVVVATHGRGIWRVDVG